MANYRANTNNKTITAQMSKLTSGEKEIIQMYLASGYKLVESKASGKRRMNKKDVLKWFDKNKNDDGKAKFEKAIKDNGYLKALADFRKENPKAIEEIKASIK